MTPNMKTERHLSENDKKQKQTLQIFYDGTANQWSSRTNVRRRFEIVAAAEDPAAPCLYVDGVGNNSLSGKLLGVGLKARVLTGYQFISQHWRSDRDEIRIFGFSRGAFQARVLSGLMAHCGVPANLQDKELDDAVDMIWDYSRKNLFDAEDGSSLSTWKQTLANNQREVQQVVRNKYPHVTFHHPRIRFLGLWDTVPGLQFSRIKNDTMLKDKDSGQRYKVRPYPNIDVIAHALALDEKRKQFAPLLVGPALDPSSTKVFEVWFPGAHSDIGGGYDDSNDMAGVAFNWVDAIMKKNQITTRVTQVYADATGIQHHPENVFPINVGGYYHRKLPVNSVIDATVFTRAANYAVPGKNSADDKQQFVKYRPLIPLQNHSYVQIDNATTMEQRQRILGPHLRLNNSESAPAQQKELKGPPLRMDQMFTDPSAANDTEAPTPPAQESPAASVAS